MYIVGGVKYRKVAKCEVTMAAIGCRDLLVIAYLIPITLYIQDYILRKNWMVPCKNTAD